MAVFRKIDTSFWQDPLVLDLTPEEKYFYLYLMTNTKTNQCGIYETSSKIMEMETGYNAETIEKLISRFVGYERILFSHKTNEIMLINWIKYNGSSSPKVLKRVETELKEIKDKNLVKKYLDLSDSFNYTLDTVSILYPYSIDTQSQEEEEEEEEEEREKEEEEEEESSSAAIVDKDFKSIVKVFNSNIHPITPIESEKLGAWLDDGIESEVIITAIEESVTYNKRSLGYINAILQSWHSNNIKTKLDLDAYMRDRKSKGGKNEGLHNRTSDTGQDSESPYDYDKFFD